MIPSGQAAKTFAAALKKRGIKVTAVTEVAAEKGDQVVASVQSMPLERIVEQVLMASDNDAAEVLFRQVAVAGGRSGSISQARKQLKITLTKLKAWHEDTVVHDGSGLSRDNRIGADTLSRLLRLASQESHPELRGLITGLPVAGVEGSLKYRFDRRRYRRRPRQGARQDRDAAAGLLAGRLRPYDRRHPGGVRVHHQRGNRRVRGEELAGRGGGRRGRLRLSGLTHDRSRGQMLHGQEPAHRVGRMPRSIGRAPRSEVMGSADSRSFDRVAHRQKTRRHATLLTPERLHP